MTSLMCQVAISSDGRSGISSSSSSLHLQTRLCLLRMIMRNLSLRVLSCCFSSSVPMTSNVTAHLQLD